MRLWPKKTSKINGNYLEKQLIFSLNKTRIPTLRQLKYLNKYLNRSEISVLIIAGLLLLGGLGFLGNKFYQQHVQATPQAGGQLIEGAIGSPKLINPLYSNLNKVDADLVELIYSSLFKRDAYGLLRQDLASDLQISPDQKTYIISLRDDVYWHNGERLTINDVIFTWQSIQNPAYKSPWRYNFNGVQLIKLDEHRLQFVLQEAYAPFAEFLTFSILPKNIWQNIDPNNLLLADYNLKPVGSGPYRFTSLTKDKNGQIKAYNLTANDQYLPHSPYIQEMVWRFYQTEEELLAALNDRKIDATGYLSSNSLKQATNLQSFNLQALNQPILTAVFFNLKDEQLKNLKLRQAMAYAINKPDLIKTILSEQAVKVDGPILPNSFAYNEDFEKYDYQPDKAKALVADLGSKAQPNINLTVTENNLDLANYLVAAWQQVGLKADLQIVEAGSVLNQVIKPKNYSAILYSLFVSVDPDPYAFWHSSQNEGMNLSNYQNNKIDKLIEDSRLNNNLAQRQADYAQFAKILNADLPAIWLFSPQYIYVQNKKLKGFTSAGINQISDRLSNISDWYINQSQTIGF